MIILETDRLVIRNWRESDRDLFFEINSDETVMAFFPFRRDRKEADAFFDHVRTLIIQTGFGFYALESKASGETIGFCGLARTDLEPFIPRGTVEIGWRLAHRFWHRGFVTEAAEALLRHGFETLDLEEIVSFAVHDNHRSISVMQRIGMLHDVSGDFDHPRVPGSMTKLRPHVLYRLTAARWQSTQTA
jgi:RimJ/RimL family protein N-acetyltransferase